MVGKQSHLVHTSGLSWKCAVCVSCEYVTLDHQRVPGKSDTADPSRPSIHSEDILKRLSYNLPQKNQIWILSPKHSGSLDRNSFRPYRQRSVSPTRQKVKQTESGGSLHQSGCFR